MENWRKIGRFRIENYWSMQYCNYATQVQANAKTCQNGYPLVI